MQVRLMQAHVLQGSGGGHGLAALHRQMPVGEHLPEQH
jgi:hypothetical protein